MATIGNLINPEYYQKPHPEQESAATWLANQLFKESEEKRIAEVDRQNRMKNLMDMAKTAEYLNSSKGIDKAGYMANNSDRYGWKIKGLDNTGNPTGLELVDNEADMQMVQRMAAARGIIPSGKNRKQLLDEIGNSTKDVVTIDPVSGDVINTFETPRDSIIRKGVMSPETIKDRAIAEGEGKAITKDIEQTSKLSGAVKRLAIINKQFTKALPSGDRTPLEQRISGNWQMFAAKHGLTDNKELVALQKNIRPIAITMIRAFGEVGNLSETEQQGAIDTVSQQGLTDAERIAATKQFIEFALAGARPESIKTLNDREDITGILDAFGVDIGQQGVKANKIGRFIVEVE